MLDLKYIKCWASVLMEMLLAHLVIARGFTQCILHCTKWKFIKQHNFCVFTRKTLHVPGSCQCSTPSHWLLQQLQLLTTLCIMITAHSVDDQHPEKWHSATIPHSLLCWAWCFLFGEWWGGKLDPRPTLLSFLSNYHIWQDWLAKKPNRSGHHVTRWCWVIT